MNSASSTTQHDEEEEGERHMANMPVIMRRNRRGVSVETILAARIQRLTLAFVALFAASCSIDSSHQRISPTALSDPPQPFVQTIPDTTVSFRMIHVPGDASGAIKPFWIAQTETTWDLYDLFVYGHDADGAADADAITRPSKPYLPPDRGWGHSGYPAISMSHHAAQQFCVWLSSKTGRTYRLPTEAEWEHACRAGSSSAYCFGDDAAELGAYAWFADNAEGKTHPVATKQPSVWNLYDMHGNAAEWCVAADGSPMTRGGSFMDDAEDLTSAARRPPSSSWNASDPQLPKSKWWLADCGFVGFRVVCEHSEVQLDDGDKEMDQ